MTLLQSQSSDTSMRLKSSAISQKFPELYRSDFTGTLNIVQISTL